MKFFSVAKACWLRHQMRHEPPSKLPPNGTPTFPPSKGFNFLRLNSSSRLSFDKFRDITCQIYNSYLLFRLQIPKSISPIPQPLTVSFQSPPGNLYLPVSPRSKVEMTDDGSHTILQQVLPSNHCSGTPPSMIPGTGTALVDLNRQATSTLVPGHSSGL